MTWPLWWWIAPAVLVFWAVGAHNRLVRLRAAVLQAFAALDGHLQRWIALATAERAPSAVAEGDPEAPATSPPQPLAPSPGDGHWTALQAAALQLQSSLGVSRLRPLDPDDTAALAAARAVLQTAWQRLLAEAPEVAGQPRPGSLHLLWDQHDTQVQLGCDQFNLAVRRYNAALTQFPAAILAWILRFRPVRTI